MEKIKCIDNNNKTIREELLSDAPLIIRIPKLKPMEQIKAFTTFEECLDKDVIWEVFERIAKIDGIWIYYQTEGKMNEKDIVRERCIHNAAIIMHDHFFITSASMARVCDNDSWKNSVFCMTLFRKMKLVFNADNSLRGVWCWI